MPEKWDFLLEEGYDLDAALGGSDREKALSAFDNLLAVEVQTWREKARGGLRPDDYVRWEKNWAGLAAAQKIVEIFRRQSGSQRTV